MFGLWSKSVYFWLSTAKYFEIFRSGKLKVKLFAYWYFNVSSENPVESWGDAKKSDEQAWLLG